MLPRRLRLSRRGFGAVRGLRRVQGLYLSLSYSVCAPQGLSGGAIIVPKKAIRSSVARHRLKRRLTPLLRPHLSPARTLILAVRPGAGSVPFPVIENELNSLLRSILPA